jgi:hypothetical protein
VGPSLTPSGSCDTADPYNWGDPNDLSSDCASYFPLIYASGDLRLSGNDQGQGILLVEGDLRMSGTVDFYGLILVRGTFYAASGTPGIGGAVLANGMGALNGTPDIIYSSCALERAILGNDAASRLTLLDDRSFVDLTNLAN